ncbi:MAG: iron-sulfur cluster assembly scaffold protein, partial [bacterium]
INYNGKVTTANLQTLIYKGEKFVAYAPYYTHSIQAQARQCIECHGTEIAKQLKRGRYTRDAYKINADKILDELGGLPEADQHCTKLAADTLHDAIFCYLKREGECG